MAYADQKMSNNRMIGLGAVVLIHILLGWLLVTGLAQKFVKQIIEPIEAVQVKEEAPPPDEPPPPPPKEVEIPPFVPPPDVQVQTDTPPPPNLAVQNTVVPPPQAYTPPAPAAPAAPPAPPAPTGPTSKAQPANARIFEVSEDDYPPSSLRAEEEGVTQVRVAINASGRVEACEVTASSNFPKLDERTCKIAQSRWRFKPALQNGTPVADTLTKRIRWQIRK